MATAASATFVAVGEPDSDMAVSVHALKGRVFDLPGWQRMAHHYGSTERCITSYLRATATKGGTMLNVNAAQDSIANTLAFRRENNLDRLDVCTTVESAPCRSYWPYAFAEAALDGSPVEICRLSKLSMSRILSDFPEDEVVHFFALWCEQTLRLYGNNVRAGATTEGSLHVYDCRDVRWATLLYEARHYWSSLSRVAAVGRENWPDLSARYFVIHAPYAVHYVWKLVSPLVGEHTKHKVSFSKGVPIELTTALGGNEAVQRALRCSPHVAPEADRSQLTRE